ncbi:hypothetical protein ONS95_014257 [Cadophora gregata]|uniref:uncharacterized protein n=1 Tax=Cadophora gregata TaxID=51156 RepID=UPI0026DA7F8D|nr:uncharacterized protein ONS95_014257 [Cadophora gregata]KAK0114774.1 hypothetical protein ONS95_014257 [Cadophora gregata]
MRVRLLSRGRLTPGGSLTESCAKNTKRIKTLHHSGLCNLLPSNLRVRQKALSRMSSSKDNAKEDSLERELGYEDTTLEAGRRSKEKRDEAKEEREREQKAERQEQMKQAMLHAAKRSKEKRKR